MLEGRSSRGEGATVFLDGEKKIGSPRTESRSSSFTETEEVWNEPRKYKKGRRNYIGHLLEENSTNLRDY